MMKINGIIRTYDNYKEQLTPSVQKSTQVKSKDQVVFSENAKDFTTIYQKLSDVPEVRQDKVDQIKKSMEEGSYNVSSREVAQKILSQNKVGY